MPTLGWATATAPPPALRSLAIPRQLYMDEGTLAQHPEGMVRVQGDLKALTQKLLKADPRGAHSKMPAQRLSPE